MIVPFIQRLTQLRDRVFASYQIVLQVDGDLRVRFYRFTRGGEKSYNLMNDVHQFRNLLDLLLHTQQSY